MDALEFLGQIAMIDELLASNEAERQELWDRATKKTSSADGMPRASGISDKVGDNAVKIVHLERKGEELIRRKESIKNVLMRLPAREYGVLHREYFRHMTQEQIASEMGYCTVQVWRIKKRALESLGKILNK